MLGSWSQLLSRWIEERLKRDVASARRNGSLEPAPPVDTPLDGLREIDPDFDLPAFLSGAKSAYEAILRAYADGDVPTLKRLVGPEVLDAFEREIVGRSDREETLQLTIIGTRETKVVDAPEEDGVGEIVVRYVSDVVSVTRSADGAVVAGDPRQIVEMIDYWTFACENRATTRVGC